MYIDHLDITGDQRQHVCFTCYGYVRLIELHRSGWWYVYLPCRACMYHLLIVLGWLVPWQPFSKVTQREGGPPPRILHAGHLTSVR